MGNAEYMGEINVLATRVHVTIEQTCLKYIVYIALHIWMIISK